MKPDELNGLIARAREAGVIHGIFGYDLGTLGALLDFYGDERAAQEREWCAKVVEAYAPSANVARTLAAAIRTALP